VAYERLKPTCILRMGAKSSNIANVAYSTLIPRIRPLTLGDRINFLSLTEPNPTDSMVKVEVFQHTDAEKCDNSQQHSVWVT
jgi:hypothetical protein